MFLTTALYRNCRKLCAKLRDLEKKDIFQENFGGVVRTAELLIRRKRRDTVATVLPHWSSRWRVYCSSLVDFLSQRSNTTEHMIKSKRKEKKENFSPRKVRKLENYANFIRRDIFAYRLNRIVMHISKLYSWDKKKMLKKQKKEQKKKKGDNNLVMWRLDWFYNKMKIDWKRLSMCPGVRKCDYCRITVALEFRM